jgi:hypothetical protein
MTRRSLLALSALPVLQGQEKEPPVDFVCPMDADVHAKGPGKCPRCGMTLVAGLPDPVEYPVRLRPRQAPLQQPVELSLEVLDPKTRRPVQKFVLMHEKYFHLFLVSEDLSFFAHEHPVADGHGCWHYTATFPKPGMYRILSDFYPEGATPQLSAQSLFVNGLRQEPKPLVRDVSPQRGENLEVQLVTEPEQPVAGQKTMLFFRLLPADGVEPYLGAWGHMLAASADLIDMIHTHPAFPEPGPQIQFNLLFPRPGMYRVWVQFQRLGKVNTVAFNVPVSELK